MTKMDRAPIGSEDYGDGNMIDWSISISLSLLMSKNDEKSSTNYIRSF